MAWADLRGELSEMFDSLVAGEENYRSVGLRIVLTQVERNRRWRARNPDKVQAQRARAREARGSKPRRTAAQKALAAARARAARAEQSRERLERQAVRDAYVVQLRSQGLRMAEIGRRLGIGRATVYKILEKHLTAASRAA